MPPIEYYDDDDGCPVVIYRAPRESRFWSVVLAPFRWVLYVVLFLIQAVMALPLLVYYRVRQSLGLRRGRRR